TEHYHDLGKALFAFGIVFWAYIGYSQYMLVWYANIPEETMWFLIRQLGGWQSLSILLVLGHFVGPFLMLISRWPKRWPKVLAAGACWMLFIHFIDLYWLVMPSVPLELFASADSYAHLVATFNAGIDPETLIAYRKVFVSKIKNHRGRVVDAKGEFASVVDAVNGAVEIQPTTAAWTSASASTWVTWW
ncbi:MAG: hypothetical protein O7C61_07475, partial [SAR324 cluster bacterium]|nr:hypothetical protein [SAR324 cluster bacterium]